MRTFLGFSLLGLLVIGCDSNSSPVAPTGTILRIDANPKTISLTGSSVITVTAIHSSGVPAHSGTEILLATSLGSVDSSIRTDDRGVAHALLQADGRAGMATVTASSGTVGTDSTIKVDVAIGAATLTADFDATIGDSLTVAFVNKSTGNPTNWEWDFGDGERSTVREPAHTYAAAGSYVVVLRVRGVDGEDSQSKRITVPSSQAALPVAIFSVASSGLLATFTDMSTGTIASWDWSFGDGARSSVRSPTHAYQAAGIYTVALTVRNAAGESTTSKSVTVPTSQLPDADFDYQETTGLRVLFRDKSTNVPTHWSWDFGDGATSHDANPTHPYSQTGTYTVALAASNLAGSSTETKFVVVRGPLVLLCHNFSLYLRAHTRGNEGGKLPEAALGAIGS